MFRSEFSVCYSGLYGADEGRGCQVQRPKCCDNNSKNEDNIPNVTNVNG